MRCLLCASRFRDCRDIGMEHTSGLIAFGRWAWSLDGVNPSVDRWMVGFLGLFLVFPSDIHFGRCEISVKINHIPIKATLSKRDIYGYSKILNSPWALRIVPIWCKVPREPLTICSTFGTPSGDRDHRGPPGTTRDRREVVTSSNFQALMMTEVPKSTLPAVLLSPLETLNGEGVNGTPIAGWFVSKSH